MSSTAQALEQALAQAVKDGKIPHAVVFATNADGSFTYSHAVGNLRNGISDEPITTDAQLQLASQTKLLAAVTALKTVELGLLALDEDVSQIVPELGVKPVFKEYDADGKPVFTKRTNPISLRKLLTHTSGLCYVFSEPLASMDAKLPAEYRSNFNEFTVSSRYAHPLMFQPGTSFTYGTGLDWAGKVLEKVHATALAGGNKAQLPPLPASPTLHDLQQAYIFGPLGLTTSDATFFPSVEQKAALPTLSLRTETGALIPLPATIPSINEGCQDAFGGHGQHVRLGAYIQVLRSLLANDGKVLRDSAPLFDDSAMNAEEEAALKAWLTRSNPTMPGDQTRAAAGEIRVRYAPGGMVYKDSDDGCRNAGTLGWGGMYNTLWTVDRDADLAVTFGTQVMPPGDAQVKEISSLVEKAVYKMRAEAAGR